MTETGCLRRTFNKRGMKMKPTTIRAIVIDPTARTITETELPTKDARVELKTLYAMIGCRNVDMVPFHDNKLIIDGYSLLADTPPIYFWQWGETCQHSRDRHNYGARLEKRQVAQHNAFARRGAQDGEIHEARCSRNEDTRK
jgi:hypothetical protein